MDRFAGPRPLGGTPHKCAQRLSASWIGSPVSTLSFGPFYPCAQHLSASWIGSRFHDVVEKKIREGAQRLSASWIGSVRAEPQKQEFSRGEVLNACRRHGS